jgi:hypothetical protein
MLVIVEMLAALEPEQEQMTPRLYGEPVALTADVPLAVLLPAGVPLAVLPLAVLLLDEALLLHALSASTARRRRAAAHRMCLMACADRIGLMTCLLVSNSGRGIFNVLEPGSAGQLPQCRPSLVRAG